jgi:GDPmannose 4,6-dehydratase
VIATGKTTSIRDVVKMAFACVGVQIDFIGQGIDEKGVVKSCHNANYKIKIGKEVLNIDPNYFRPTEVDLLLGDATKAKEKLGWKPEIHLEELIQEMVLSDLNEIKE